MKAKKYMIANQKGGVTKTTTAVNLAHYLAIQGKKVLLADFDTQGNCKSNLGVDQQIKPKMFEFFMDFMEAPEAIDEIRDNLFLIYGGQNLAKLKAILVSGEQLPDEILKERFSYYEKEFDYIIIDSSPSWDLLNSSLIIYTDFVIIPTTMESGSINGVLELSNIIRRASKKTDISIAGIFPARLDMRYKHTKEFLDAVAEPFEKYLRSPIRTNSSFEKAYMQGKTIFEYEDPRGIEDYTRLAKEMFSI